MSNIYKYLKETCEWTYFTIIVVEKHLGDRIYIYRDSERVDNLGYFCSHELKSSILALQQDDNYCVEFGDNFDFHPDSLSNCVFKVKKKIIQKEKVISQCELINKIEERHRKALNNMIGQFNEKMFTKYNFVKVHLCLNVPNFYYDCSRELEQLCSVFINEIQKVWGECYFISLKYDKSSWILTIEV